MSEARTNDVATAPPPPRKSTLELAPEQFEPKAAPAPVPAEKPTSFWGVIKQAVEPPPSATPEPPPAPQAAVPPPRPTANIAPPIQQPVAPPPVTQAQEPEPAPTPFDYRKAPGMVTPGTIADPWNRPVLQNPDGSYSTTSSMSIGTDEGETLIPTVVEGKRLTPEDAIQHFHQTGEHLGIFKTPEQADTFATQLHNEQAKRYTSQGQPLPQQDSIYKESPQAPVPAPEVKTAPSFWDKLKATLPELTGGPETGGMRVTPETVPVFPKAAETIAQPAKDLATSLQETGRGYGEALAELSRPEIVAERAGRPIPSVATAPEGEPIAAQAGTREWIAQRLAEMERRGLEQTPGGMAALSFAGGITGEGAYSARFAEAELRDMLKDAITAGVLPKGSRVDDLKAYLDEVGAQRAAQAQAAAQPPAGTAVTPVTPQPPAVRLMLPQAAAGGRGVGPPQPPGSGAAPRAPTEPEAGMPGAWTAEPFEMPRGPVDETPAMKAMRLGWMHRIQDRLAELHGQAESDKLRFTEFYNSLEKLTPEEKLQIERYIEWQPGMPRPVAPTPRALRIINEVIKPTNEQAIKDLNWLKGRSAIPEDMLEEATEGYIHRMVISPRRPMGGSPFDPFGGVRSLRQKTSGMQKRQFFVLQRANGDRFFVRRAPDKPYGTKIRDSRGNELEYRRATMEEVEANTDVRYYHDPVLSTLQNASQLRIARRNVEALQQEIFPHLVDQGLAVTDRDAARQLGFKETVIPALRNRFFEERIANAFDDFWRTPSFMNMGDLGRFGAMNRFAINMMFVNPVGHMRNVLSDAALGRGGLWFSGPAYQTLMQTSRQALNDVLHKTPFYHEVLKNGGSLMGASASNQVAYVALMNKIRAEMAHDPIINRIAQETGVWKTGKEWGRALWDHIQNAMWGLHDIVTLQRVRELMGRGMSMPDAIREAEKYIANYRVPASVGEGGKVINFNKKTGRFLSTVFQDRTLTVFGRYHYNKLRSIANTVREASEAMRLDGMPLAERVQKAGRLSFMLIASAVVPPILNFVLQQATGNPEARVHTPGTIGIPANTLQVMRDLYKGEFGQAGFDFAMALLSVITPIPAGIEFLDQIINRDVITGQPVRGTDLPWWKQGLEMGEHAARQFLSPFGEAEQVGRMFGTGARGGGIPSLGVSTPDPAAVERARRGPKPRQLMRQRRYEEEQFKKRIPFAGPAGL